jgi:hypothetical protein
LKRLSATGTVALVSSVESLRPTPKVPSSTLFFGGVLRWWLAGWLSAAFWLSTVDQISIVQPHLREKARERGGGRVHFEVEFGYVAILDEIRHCYHC